MNLQRGYIGAGKDRQHPVTEPGADDTPVAAPLQWAASSATRTWYASIGADFTYVPLWELTPPEGG